MLSHVVDWLASNAQATISGLAFFVALTHAWYARSHNKQAVRPLLALKQRQSRNDSEGLIFEISIRNVGLGPALIEAAQMSYSGARYVDISRESLDSFCDTVLKKPRPHMETHALSLGTAVAKDERIVLIGLKAQSTAEEDALIEALQGASFEFRIAYQTQYSETFILDTKRIGVRPKRVRRWLRPAWIEATRVRPPLVAFRSAVTKLPPR